MIFSIAVVLMFSDDLINTRCVTLTITGHFIELMVNGKNLSKSVHVWEIKSGRGEVYKTYRKFAF